MAARNPGHSWPGGCQFDEPPLCPPCALYASKACPMVAGRQDRYADRVRLSEGPRGHVCPDEGCDCGGWVPSDPNSADASGQPAHPWYALTIAVGQWQTTAHKVRARCTDKGCVHDRLVVNGAYLLGEPLRVVEVSTPVEGRVWRSIPANGWAALLGPVREVAR